MVEEGEHPDEALREERHRPSALSVCVLRFAEPSEREAAATEKIRNRQ
jgi:hypothetical protein